MTTKLIECVPNFSEGRDMSVIKAITDAIESVDGVKLLNVDPGYATNRTVVTFVGDPDAVCEGAFRGVRKAKELIDMRRHTGEHPRQGACDVLPLVPISGVTMDECVSYARKLAMRVGNELNIPVYCYENAAFTEQRRNLAACRAGEYESLSSKLYSEEWKPDFGMPDFTDEVARSGASVIGARDFLIAVNFNLNTTSVRRANAISFDVREKGRPMREGGGVTGKPIKDENGNAIMLPGTLKGTKAIGWYIEEYGIAQVSMNITDITATPLHIAWEEVNRKAFDRGIRVSGTEIVGLVPKSVLIDAGNYFLDKQQRSKGISEKEIIKIAIKSMGLDDLRPFNAEDKVIEYLINDNVDCFLTEMTVESFAEETASESPAPGGGSVSAYIGALGASLGTMVANLSSHKQGWDSRWAEFSNVAVKGHTLMRELLDLVDEDTRAFNDIMDVFSMPKTTDFQKQLRKEALENATLYAIEVPFRTMQKSYEVFDILRSMAEKGNPNSVSDVGVGVLSVRCAVFGAYLNVKINAASLKDRESAEIILAKASEIISETEKQEREILEIVYGKI